MYHCFVKGIDRGIAVQLIPAGATRRIDAPAALSNCLGIE